MEPGHIFEFRTVALDSRDLWIVGRQNHTVVPNKQDEIGDYGAGFFIIGGISSMSRLDDMWHFDMATDTCSPCFPRRGHQMPECIAQNPE